MLMLGLSCLKKGEIMKFKRIIKNHQHLISIFLDCMQIINVFIKSQEISIFIIIIKSIINLIKEGRLND